MTARIRPDIVDLPSYKAGRRPKPVEGLTVYKLSSNENPFPPLPGVLEAIGEAASAAHRYPDPLSTQLVAALSERFGVPSDWIALGTGSVALCGQLVTATCSPGDEVLYGWRSFEAYPIWAQMGGAVSIQVALDDEDRFDLDAMASAITATTRLIFVCNPNNPTGTAVRRDELVAFLNHVPHDVVVVIDEAYIEFVTDPEVPDALTLIFDRPNVVVLRTFSKAYGLAGLRVGFAVAHPFIAEALTKTMTPFGISGVAEAAAIASLEPVAEKELMRRVGELVGERERMGAALTNLGWRIADSQANFLWLRTGEHTEALFHAAEAAGLTVRPFAGEGTRVSIAEPEANDRFLEVAADFLKAHPEVLV
jgi:histidinol-phosphate aminotransferase